MANGASRANAMSLLRPVFLHSSFRTSSTWLWSKFRANDRAIAFYEVFHPVLATLKPEQIQHYRPDNWPSKHPNVGPYFLEFAPLLSKSGGIEGFCPEMGVSHAIPGGGLQSAVADQESAYVRRLVWLAQAQSRTPVLTCKRSLGRISALKASVDCWHMFSFRNLYHQWLSYLSQAQKGFSYFLGTTMEAVTKNRHDPFLQYLFQKYGSSESGSDEREIGAGLEQFEVFAGLHLYLYMNATIYADQIIDVSRMARDKVYRRWCEDEIRLQTGLQVSFADASNSVETWIEVPPALDELEERLYQLHKTAGHFLDLQDNSSALAFGRQLVGSAVDAMRQSNAS
jgi:hypothetical protein